MCDQHIVPFLGWLQLSNQWTYMPIPKAPDNLPPEFGTVINNLTPEPNPDNEEYEKKIDLLNQEKIILSVTRELFGKIEQQATFHNRTVEEQTLHLLGEALNVQIGRATINRPSTLSGQRTGLIKGPSFAVNSDHPA